jgi:hypothetical protein
MRHTWYSVEVLLSYAVRKRKPPSRPRGPCRRITMMYFVTPSMIMRAISVDSTGQLLSLGGEKSKLNTSVNSGCEAPSARENNSSVKGRAFQMKIRPTVISGSSLSGEFVATFLIAREGRAMHCRTIYILLHLRRS